MYRAVGEYRGSIGEHRDSRGVSRGHAKLSMEDTVARMSDMRTVTCLGQKFHALRTRPSLVWPGRNSVISS